MRRVELEMASVHTALTALAEFDMNNYRSFFKQRSRQPRVCERKLT